MAFFLGQIVGLMGKNLAINLIVFQNSLQRGGCDTEHGVLGGGRLGVEL